MQYILTQEEFDEFQRLKQADQAEKTDAALLFNFLAGLDSMCLANWGRAAGQLPAEQMAPLYDLVTKMNALSERYLLQEWRQRQPDFFQRKLAQRCESLDRENDQVQNPDQLAAVNT